MASYSGATAIPQVHKKADAKDDGGVDAENVQGTTDQRVIIIGAGEVFVLNNIKHSF